MIGFLFVLFDIGSRFIFLNAGGPSMYCSRWSNEAATVHADITADHRDVPANFSVMGRGSTQEPPSRFLFSNRFKTKPKSFSFMSMTVRFSQSEFLPTSSDGTVASSCLAETKQGLLFEFSLIVSSISSCQVY